MAVDRRPRTMPKPMIVHTRESSFVSLLSGWVQQGVESFFATQRILIELATQQNANAMKMVKSHLFGSNVAPAELLTEMAGSGTTNFIEAQKVLLEMAQRQNELIMTGVKERVDSNVVNAMTEMIRRSVDTFIGMQQHFLNMADKNSTAMFDAVKTGKPYKGDGIIHMARQAMDSFVDAQKKFLDVVAEETANAADGKYGMIKKGKKTEYTKMAEQAMEAFVDAQKKLLDLATNQMSVNMKVAGEAAGMLPTFSLSPFAQLTKDVVNSYVEAHKALLDVMVRPIHRMEQPTAKAMSDAAETVVRAKRRMGSRARAMAKAATA